MQQASRIMHSQVAEDEGLDRMRLARDIAILPRLSPALMAAAVDELVVVAGLK